MGTAFSAIITEALTLYLDDIQLNEEMAANPALTLRKLCYYIKSGAARFNRPPEMKEYLSYTAETVDNAVFYTASALPSGTVLDITAKPGFEVVSVTLADTDEYGDPVCVPWKGFTYNTTSGTITLTELLPANSTLDIDYYTDGYFTNTLDDKQIRLLCLCMQIVWEFRLAGNWLNRQPKIHDKDYSPISEASMTKADTERYREWKQALDDELEAYAQGLTYDAVIPRSGRLKL